MALTLPLYHVQLNITCTLTCWPHNRKAQYYCDMFKIDNITRHTIGLGQIVQRIDKVHCILVLIRHTHVSDTHEINIADVPGCCFVYAIDLCGGASHFVHDE